MEKKMENDTETGILQGIMGGKGFLKLGVAGLRASKKSVWSKRTM